MIIQAIPDMLSSKHLFPLNITPENVAAIKKETSNITTSVQNHISIILKVNIIFSPFLKHWMY